MDIKNINLVIEYMKSMGYKEKDLMNDTYIEEERNSVGYYLYELNYRLCKLEEELYKGGKNDN